MDWILGKIGFIRVRGKWMPKLYAKKLMEIAAVNNTPEAHETYLEIFRQLYKEKE